MCGFVGILNRDQRPIDVSTIRGMSEIQRHRGPDDHALGLFALHRKAFQRIASNGNPTPSESYSGALGFNRLSILDTSELGRQPMSTPDGQVHLVFNGEIYNYQTLTEKWSEIKLILAK